MAIPGRPVFTAEQYSRSASVDLETAISLAVKAAISGTFPGPGGKGKVAFSETFEDWATFEDNFVTPAAAVLPQDELLYGPSHLTPALLEDTWEPPGEAGFGLYELSEGSREVHVQIRSSNQQERNALKAGVEGAFVRPSVLMVPAPVSPASSAQDDLTNKDSGVRYGLIVRVPEYWNLPVRLELLGSRKLDDSEHAARNQWEAEFRIAAQASHVVLRPVRPFRVKVRQLEVGDQVKPRP